MARLSGEQTAKCLYWVRRTTELRRASPGYDTIMVTDKDEREIIGVYISVLATGKRGRR